MEVVPGTYDRRLDGKTGGLVYNKQTLVLKENIPFRQIEIAVVGFFFEGKFLCVEADQDCASRNPVKWCTILRESCHLLASFAYIYRGQVIHGCIKKDWLVWADLI